MSLSFEQLWDSAKLCSSFFNIVSNGLLPMEIYSELAGQCWVTEIFCVFESTEKIYTVVHYLLYAWSSVDNIAMAWGPGQTAPVSPCQQRWMYIATCIKSSTYYPHFNFTFQINDFMALRIVNTNHATTNMAICILKWVLQYIAQYKWNI